MCRQTIVTTLTGHLIAGSGTIFQLGLEPSAKKGSKRMASQKDIG